MINDLIKLATHLDNKGLCKEANYVDFLIKRSADTLGFIQEDREFDRERRRLEELGLNRESLANYLTELGAWVNKSQLEKDPEEFLYTFLRGAHRYGIDANEVYRAIGERERDRDVEEIYPIPGLGLEPGMRQVSSPDLED